MKLLEEFHQEFLGLPWREDENRRRLRELAEEYHSATETYDRTVCTGPVVDGSIRPATPREFFLINRFARMVNQKLLKTVEDLGFSRSDWSEEKRSVLTNIKSKKQNSE